MNKIGPLVTAILVAIFAASQALFVVDEREFVMISQFGEVVDIRDQPGLSWKIPFVQNTRRYSKQILTLDSPDTDRFNTKENQPVQWIRSSNGKLPMHANSSVPCKAMNVQPSDASDKP
jgi:modulator of FtsH protease HflC